MANAKISSITLAKKWFHSKGWTPFPFQVNTWKAYAADKNGIVNAPTGSGKSYALLIPIILEGLAQTASEKPGLKAIWITPLRALAKEIKLTGDRALEGLGLDWKIGIRSGDTSSSERTKQKKQSPQILITTPESLHLLMASNGYTSFFKDLKTIVIDEWHELLGSKRGVQMELALARLRGMLPALKTWGISATIGNMEQAAEVLLGHHFAKKNWVLIRSDLEKKIDIHTILPDEIERFPWAGHLGLTLINKVLPVIEQSKTTLIFTNTRAQCEMWYQRLLEVSPDLAGVIAMHHGSIGRELRDWVEEALHNGQLKTVVCTSSLDLGVDFRPVETIIQVGSPKGVARFVQRAGRSGHQPGATSKIYFLPTHSLELIEASALRSAIRSGQMESRLPYIRSFDVLSQFMVTMAVSEGFEPDELLAEIRTTHAFASVTREEWNWLLQFISTGGPALEAYEDHKRVGAYKGRYYIMNKRLATRHRLSMGTIVGETSMTVKYMRGSKIGTVEEWFVSQLKPGDVFWFAGRSLELVNVKGMEVRVKKSKKKTGKVPAWLGGRLPLSSQLSEALREQIGKCSRGDFDNAELQKIAPLIELQESRSGVPDESQFLVEYFQSREGYHLLFYPFAGRAVHEGMSTLFAWRLSQIQPISFTIAMNDYGFELLADTEIPIDAAIRSGLFSTKNLLEDIQAGVNSVEMAKRRFRDIAAISGLIFKGFPGREKKDRHVQSSSQLFFDAFREYEPDNLLLRQAYDEVLTFQFKEADLRAVLQRINQQQLMLSRPPKATPFSFPIIVDRLREKLSSEKLKDRIEKMRVRLVRR